MSKLGGYLAASLFMFTDMYGSMEEKAKAKCEKLREDYANLQNLPRKKKKQEKKRILLEWQIFSYNPFTGTTYDWL